MDFSERLRAARKAAGFSQEQLAESLNVSRQAVTKWETGRGIPDIANVVSLSRLFGIGLDALLTGADDAAGMAEQPHGYQSVTEYDIDGAKCFDLSLGGAASLCVSASDGEKVRVVLSSPSLSGLEKNFKVKIDDIKGRIDISVNRSKRVSEAQAKDALDVTVMLPAQYLVRLEAECNCRSLCMENVSCNHAEFSGRAECVSLRGVQGTVELDCNLDMEVDVHEFVGRLELNQLGATSRLTVPADFAFCAVTKGIANRILFCKDGKAAEDFSTADADNVIELNGMKSELTIERGQGGLAV